MNGIESESDRPLTVYIVTAYIILQIIFGLLSFPIILQEPVLWLGGLLLLWYMRREGLYAVIIFLTFSIIRLSSYLFYSQISIIFGSTILLFDIVSIFGLYRMRDKFTYVFVDPRTENAPADFISFGTHKEIVWFFYYFMALFMVTFLFAELFTEGTLNSTYFAPVLIIIWIIAIIAFGVYSLKHCSGIFYAKNV